MTSYHSGTLRVKEKDVFQHYFTKRAKLPGYLKQCRRAIHRGMLGGCINYSTISLGQG